jgi:ectoine hydroxylase-related dioxygenase (phytanoyl-CoA dioxygenase family)
MANAITDDLPDIFRKHRMPTITDADLSSLDEQGYLVVKDAIPLELCDHLYQRLSAIAEFESTSKKGGYFYGSGSMQRVYQLLGKDEIFRNLLLHPICDQVMSHMFYRPTYHDKYYLTSFHGNILQPGAEPQIWHVDANVPDPLPTWIIRANSNFVIQDYTEENGATEIIPGSHKLLRKPNKAEAESHKFERLQMCAPKGSLVFWHGHLWHRSGSNYSSGNRAALLATYAASFFREVCMEENPFLYLNTNTSSSLSPQLKRLIGWDHGAKYYA